MKKFNKPTKFSDPYSDWKGYEDVFQTIIKKPESQLDIEDFQIIFAKLLPAAEYSEGLYFIEPCLSYVSEGHDVFKSRFPDGLIWWIMDHQEKLKNEGLFLEILKSIEATFWKLVDFFEIFELSENDFQRYGVDPKVGTVPFNHQTLMDLIDDLLSYPELFQLWEKLLSKMKSSIDNNHSRWYIEICRHSREWLMYPPVYKPDLKERAFHSLHEFCIFNRKYSISFELSKLEKKGRYLSRISTIGF